jgi:hemerythrin-like metal-binding protein
MAIFEWDESLVIGIVEIDNQHKELVKRLDSLATAILKGQGKEKIGAMIMFMEQYGNKHFLDEEELMANHDYPGLTNQRNHHKKFKETTIMLTNQLESHKNMEFFSASVQRYLIDWLILHIKSEDMKFGEFLRKNDK